MGKDLQVIILGISLIVCLALSSWAQGAVDCKVTYNNVDTGMMIIQCPAKTTIGAKVGDKIKGSKVVKKDYEGC